MKERCECIKINMALMSPPCTILLRINGDFERISDAAVIENGDHLFYEKPVGSVVVLEETSEKVLYIMKKDDISSTFSLTENSVNQNQFDCSGDTHSLDLTSQQQQCTCNTVNCITNLNGKHESAIKVDDFAYSSLQSSTREGIIDSLHANNCENHYQHDDMQELKGNKTFSVGNSLQLDGQLKLDVHSTKKRERDGSVSNSEEFSQSISHSVTMTKNTNLPTNQLAKCEGISCEGSNQFTTQLSTMVAEVHTNGDEQKRSDEEEDNRLDGTKKCAPFVHNKKSVLDNKTIIDNENGIESNKRAVKEPSNTHNNFLSMDINEKQVNENLHRNSHFEDPNIGPVSNEISSSIKVKILPTISMASLTSSLDSGSNWIRPLRRRSTLSTIISTASSTNTATSNAKKLQSANNHPSLLSKEFKNTNHRKLVSGDDNKFRSQKPMSNEMETKNDYKAKVKLRSHKSSSNANELDIEEKILQRREMAHLFKWYYPEGGWGWVILCAAMFSQVFGHGVFQLGFSYPLGIIIRIIYSTTQQQNQNLETASSIIYGKLYGNELGIQLGNITSNNLNGGVTTESDVHITQLQIGCLAATSFFVSLAISPAVMLFCRNKSTRLTAVVGGLIVSLGILFTSFAKNFPQIFFSYGTVIAIGIGMLRDSATVMVGQYFKKKRSFVEMMLMGSSGIGVSISSPFLLGIMRSHGWRYGLQIIAGLILMTVIGSAFYRSATLYHPQRRAILHLKSQRRKVLEVGPGGSGTDEVRKLKAYKNLSLHIIIASSFMASFGVSVPVVYLIQCAFDGKSQEQTLVLHQFHHIQILIGVSWILGCFVFGRVIMKPSLDCQMSKPRLTQLAVTMLALLNLALPYTAGYTGISVYSFFYGFFYGGYSLTLKLYIYEIGRPRHFCFLWSILQLGQAIGHGIGIPLVVYLNQVFEDYCDCVGSYVVTIFMFMGAAFFQAGHAYRRYRKNKRNKRKKSLACNREGSSNVDFHKKDCPKHAISQCLTEGSLTEKATNTVDREIKLMNGNENDEEDLNASEDSSNCEDQDDDEAVLADSILELFQRRHSSDVAMEEWKKIEAILMSNCCQQIEDGVDTSKLNSNQHKNTENHQAHIAEGLMAIVDDISMAPNMVENKVVMSELEQNMLKEDELTNREDGHKILPSLQNIRMIDAGRVQRRRLNKRLWSLRRQSSDFDSSYYNSSSAGNSNSASSGPSSSSSSSASGAKLPHNYAASSALSTALSSAMLAVSAPVSKTPEKPFDEAYTDLLERFGDESRTPPALFPVREIPNFRKPNHKMSMLKNQRSITTVIEEVSTG